MPHPRSKPAEVPKQLVSFHSSALNKPENPIIEAIDCYNPVVQPLPTKAGRCGAESTGFFGVTAEGTITNSPAGAEARAGPANRRTIKSRKTPSRCCPEGECRSGRPGCRC